MDGRIGSPGAKPVWTKTAADELDGSQAVKNRAGLGLSSTIAKSQSEAQQEVYAQNPNTPNLPKPSGNTQQIPVAQKQNLLEEAELVMQSLEANDAPSYSDQGKEIRKKGEDALNDVAKKLAQLKKQSGDSPEAENLAKSLQNLKQTLDKGPGVNSKQGMKDFHQELQGQLSDVGTKMNALTKNQPNDAVGQLTINELESTLKSGVADINNSIDQFNKMDPDIAAKYVAKNFDQSAYTNGFESELQKMIDSGQITEAEAATIRNAFYSGVDNPTVDKIKNSLNIPKDFVPDGTSHTAKVMGQVDAKLQELLPGLGLSDEQMSQVEHLFYNRDASFPDGAKLKSIVANLEVQIRQSLGIPDGMKTPINGNGFNSLAWGEFSFAFNNQIAKLSGPEQKAVLQGLKNPLGGVTPETKALINKVYSQALAEVKGKMTLPAGWTPPIAVLSAVANPVPALQPAMAALGQMSEYAASIKSMASSMKTGPEKAEMMNILKVVTEALSGLKKMLAQTQISDSELASKFSESELEATLDKIEKQRKEQMERLQKKSKPAALKVFSTMFKWAMAAILTVASLGVLGPTIVTAAVYTQIALGIAEIATGEDVLAKSFDAAYNMMIKVLTPMIGEDAAKAMGVMTNALMMAALTAFTGPLAGSYLVINSTKSISRILGAMGVPKNVASILEMTAGMIYEVTFMIVTMVLTGGATGAMISAQIAKVAAQIGAKVANAIAKALTTIANTVGKASEIAGKVIQKMADAFLKLAQKFQKMVTKAMQAMDDIPKLNQLQQKSSQKFLSLHEMKDEIAKLQSKVIDFADNPDEIFNISKELDDVLNNAKNLIDDITDDAVKLQKQGQLKTDQMNQVHDLYNSVTRAQAANQNLKAAGSALKQNPAAGVDDVFDAANKIGRNMSDFGTKLPSKHGVSGLKNFNFQEDIVKGLYMVRGIMEGSAAIADGVASIKISEATKRRAQLREEIEILSVMIKSWNDMIKKLIQGIEDMASDMQFTSGVQDNIFKGLSQTLGAITK